MARTYRRKSNTRSPQADRYAARFVRERPIDMSLLSKAFVEIARAMAEHDAQQLAEQRKDSSHEKTA